MDHIVRGPDSAIELPKFQRNVSVIEILYQAMKDNGENIAQIEANTRRTITFSEFLKKSIWIAANLTNYGVTIGDVVVLCLEKSILSYSLLTGIIFTGATVALGKHDFTEESFQHQLRICKPKMIFCSIGMYTMISKFKDVRKSIFFFPNGPCPELDGRIFTQENDQDFTVYRVNDTKNHFPIISYISTVNTSTTKFVLVPNISLQRYGFSSRKVQRLLFMAPWSSISSVMTFVASVMNNYTIVLSENDPVLQLQYTQYYKVDTWMINPAMMRNLLSYPFSEQYDISSVKLIFSGGSYLNPQLKKTFLEKIFRYRVLFDHIYGSTEAGVITTYKYVNPTVAKTNVSSGKLTSGALLKVIDRNGISVGPRKEGELRVKSESMMTQYLQDPENKLQAFDSEGWFCTGDYGYFDYNGLIYILGRLSDLIFYKHYRICTAFVETILETHPAIQEAVVVAKPHPHDCQHPTAFVVLKPNTMSSAENLQAHFDDLFIGVLDIYKLRGGVHFLDFLPKLPNGKVLRTILRHKCDI